MRRIQEIINETRSRYPKDDFFSNFERSCQTNPAKKRFYERYEDALRSLDQKSWEVLKKKALDQFMNHRKNGKEGFFNQLNEAFAYKYLSKRNNFVEIIPEKGDTTPDLRFGIRRNRPKYCEVKTLGMSDDEIKRRESQQAYDGEIYVSLSEGFFNKFQCAINTANKQIHAQSEGAQGFIFILLMNDDIALDHYQQYRKQIISFCYEKGINNLYVKVGLRGNKRIDITKKRQKTAKSATADLNY